MTNDRNVLAHRLIGVGAYGGKFIPERAYGRLDNAVRCCVGAGEDISFDVALAQDGHRVHVFDPTPRAKIHFDALMQAAAAGTSFGINGSESSFYDITPSAMERIAFHAVGLWGADEMLKFYAPKKCAARLLFGSQSSENRIFL